MMKDPTISDVAERAGVSIGTVSRVINGAVNVKKQNMERIQEAIKELNFRPNQYAKNLKSNKSNIVGIIVPNLVDEFYINLINQIEQTMTLEGYLLVVFSSRDSSELEHKYINYLWEKRVDGILITSSGQNEDLLQKIMHTGTAVVFVDRKPQANIFDTVYADKQNSARIATSHLIQNGHKRIALVTGPKSLSTNVDRFNGYTRTMYDNELPINNRYIWFGEFNTKCGLEFMKWYVRQDPDERPTAIICGSQMITYGCLLAAKEYGIRIPDEMSIVSYGNVGYEKLIAPQLTYIQQMDAEISKASAQLLIDKLNNRNDYPRQIVMKPEIIIQDSVKNLIL